MVTRNDYNLGVFNGDIGITLPSEEAGGDLRVFFPGADGGMRAFAPTRVPDHETAYAMTVHKSQGSEFEQVLLVLGNQPSRVLTRELLYTGMTRARSRVEIWGSEALLRRAVATRIQRSSGLRAALWNGKAK
jgi:exodeoxyribonuclease V alpha subunit